MSDGDGILSSKKDFAEFLGVRDVRSVTKMAQHGLPFTIIEGRWMGTKRAVLDWLRRLSEHRVKDVC